MELDNRMVSAEWLKDKFYEICDEYNTCLLHVDRLIDEIDDAPDVEVVRCKDCWRGDKYYNHPSYIYCIEHNKLFEERDFCSYGERKDNG